MITKMPYVAFICIYIYALIINMCFVLVLPIQSEYVIHFIQIYSCFRDSGDRGREAKLKEGDKGMTKDIE